jgi:hypothetical protein
MSGAGGAGPVGNVGMGPGGQGLPGMNVNNQMSAAGGIGMQGSMPNSSTSGGNMGSHLAGGGGVGSQGGTVVASVGQQGGNMGGQMPVGHVQGMPGTGQVGARLGNQFPTGPPNVVASSGGPIPSISNQMSSQQAVATGQPMPPRMPTPSNIANPQGMNQSNLFFILSPVFGGLIL